MLRIIKVIYIKWVLKQCKHCCMWCKYKNVCFDEFNYYDGRKKVKR